MSETSNEKMPELRSEMTTEQKAQEALDVLKAIEAGDVTAIPVELPSEVRAGNVEYILSNGWRIKIFNDNGDWDYINSFTLPTGEILDFEAMSARRADETPIYPELVHYRPPGKVMKDAYRWKH